MQVWQREEDNSHPAVAEGKEQNDNNQPAVAEGEEQNDNNQPADGINDESVAESGERNDKTEKEDYEKHLELMYKRRAERNST